MDLMIPLPELDCFLHFKQTIPKVCIIKAISYNPMKTTKRVNDQTVSVHYFTMGAYMKVTRKGSSNIDPANTS
jgi:hypothetical protein